MSNLEQGSQPSSRHRYSVRQLLDLSATACVPFDLSKFSFDAARAGVIPSLNECAADSRKSSASFLRVVSATGAPISEPTDMHRTCTVQEPTRDAQPPPSSLLAQQNSGFARFLKKHTSPTHQRVTAGGRIVPIESKYTPPPFTLITNKIQDKKKSNVLTHEQQQFIRDQGNGLGKDVLEQSSYRTEPQSSDDTMPELSDINHSREGIFGLYGLGKQNFTEQRCHQRDNIDNRRLPASDLVPVMSPCPNVLPGFVPSSTQWQSGFSNQPFTTCQPTLVCPQNDFMMSNWAQATPSAQEMIDQQIFSAQNSLLFWNNYYNELDQQLKALDRHRAMTSLSLDMVNQRRVIVQQRSDTKDIVDKLREFLAMNERIVVGTDSMPCTLTFNAAAPAYIPVDQQDFATASDLITATDTATRGLGCLFEKPKGTGTRRPIPIVRPPNLQIGTASPSLDDTISPQSPDANVVDEWGVNIGSAPPDLKQQQNEIAQSMSEAFGPLPAMGHKRENVSYGVCELLSRHEKYNAGDSYDESRESGSGHGLESKERYPPHEVEKVYEQELDALCQPRGISTKVCLPDGFFIEVQGQNLQSPAPENMTEFEKRYWSQKTVETHRPREGNKSLIPARFQPSAPLKATAVTQTSDRNSISEDSNFLLTRKENVTRERGFHRKSATEIPKDPSDSAMTEKAQRSRRNETQSLQDWEIFDFDTSSSSRMQHRTKYRPSQAIGHGNLPAREQINQEIPGDQRQLWQDRRTETQQLSVQEFGRVTEENFNTKGYSSTSLQNVHAVAQSPQHLDDPTNSTRKGTRSVLSFVGKIKSPRLLRQSTANGQAWYGPYCREIIERALTADGTAWRPNK